MNRKAKEIAEAIKSIDDELEAFGRRRRQAESRRLRAKIDAKRQRQAESMRRRGYHVN